MIARKQTLDLKNGTIIEIEKQHGYYEFRVKNAFSHPIWPGEMFLRKQLEELKTIIDDMLQIPD